jgi:uncharacterized membrane protein
MVLALLWLFTGLVLAVLAIPLIRGQVGMNYWYGVRVKRSYESEELWYKINRQGGKLLLVGGLIVAFLGATALFLDLEGHTGLLIFYSFAPLAVMIAVAVGSVWYAREA